jgi:lysophospholipase L1-like esterase
MKFCSVRAIIFVAACVGAAHGQTPTAKFDFGPGPVAKGYAQVTERTLFTKESGYGFEGANGVECRETKAKDALRGDFCGGAKPFFFSAALPEGNYLVTVTLGDGHGVSNTTIKAETRRLMLENVSTRPGMFVSRSFTVNIRNSQIVGGGQVRLKEREMGALHWDDKLTLEFNGTRPRVAAVEIRQVTDAVTIYLAGDSTVTDQQKEPYAAWGQMLPRFFKPSVAVANHAESGETLKAFRGERRLDKVLSQIMPGDYLFIQFAHNDQKPGNSHVDPFTTYKEQLKIFIAAARKKGATPVLLTSMNRRTFDEKGSVTNSLLDYPEAMRQTAREENVALIDLHAMSKSLYEAWGPQDSVKAFVHYPANTYPEQPQSLKDDTHFNNYGAYELSRCVVEGIKANKLGLVKHLTSEAKPFDPSRPDDVAQWNFPASPLAVIKKPDGN